MSAHYLSHSVTEDWLRRSLGARSSLPNLSEEAGEAVSASNVNNTQSYTLSDVHVFIAAEVQKKNETLLSVYELLLKSYIVLLPFVI